MHLFSQKKIIKKKDRVHLLWFLEIQTTDRSKMITSTDRRNFKALCRGLDLLPTEKSKHFKCFYRQRGEEGDPFFWMQPLKVRGHVQTTWTIEGDGGLFK